MPGSRAQKRQRRKLLAELAAELSSPRGPGPSLRPRLRCTWRLSPYLSVRKAGRGRLRVYCASDAGQYAFVTGSGQVIRLDEGIAAAAGAVAAATARDEPGQPVPGRASAVQPGP
jgi:hypothetical protein